MPSTPRFTATVPELSHLIFPHNLSWDGLPNVNSFDNQSKSTLLLVPNNLFIVEVPDQYNSPSLPLIIPELVSTPLPLIVHIYHSSVDT